jgi:hypothetical protein
MVVTNKIYYYNDERPWWRLESGRPCLRVAGGHVLGERTRAMPPESIQIPWSDWLFHESYCFVAIAPHNADVFVCERDPCGILVVFISI